MKEEKKRENAQPTQAVSCPADQPANRPAPPSKVKKVKKVKKLKKLKKV